MLLTLTCDAVPDSPIPATDLGFLLHKNPASVYERDLSFGTVRVFYPEATAERCTAALLVEVDPVGLVRKGGGNTLAQYVSDRPYAPSSFLCVALAEAFGTALGGKSKDRQELVDVPLSLTATLTALDCDGGEALIRRLFEPLGYTVTVQSHGLRDDRFPEWGDSDLYTVTLSAQTTVQNLLTHLYVLIPVLDNAKHYFIGDDEADKLVRRGEGWLNVHPERELVALRYLRYRRPLAESALVRLADVEGVPEEAEETVAAKDANEEKLEKPVRLNDQRVAAAIAAVRSLEPPARRVIDLGCGEGKTLTALRGTFPALEHLAGMDVSTVALSIAARRLHLDERPDPDRIALFQGSLVYRDARLTGFDVALLNEVNATKPAPEATSKGRYDVALLMEVLEHIDLDRLPIVERVIFEFARPRRVVVTTPNAEYNSVWPSLPAGKFRHADHRFEWTRAQFEAWANNVANRFRYTVTFSGIGDEDTDGRGAPTQMAIFDDA